MIEQKEQNVKSKEKKDEKSYWFIMQLVFIWKANNFFDPTKSFVVTGISIIIWTFALTIIWLIIKNFVKNFINKKKEE